MTAMADVIVSNEPGHASVGIIDLSGDDLGLPTPVHVREAAKRALDEGATHYTTRPGLDSLRRAVAGKLLRENSLTVDPEREVLITCGTQEALFVALHVLLERGDEAIIPEPARDAYAGIARLAGARVRSISGAAAHGFAIDLDMLARRLTKRSRVVILGAPLVPAGVVHGEAVLEGLAALAIERNLVIVSDEIAEPFVYDGAFHRSIGSLPGMAERTITINGFATAYAMHGWRVGYMAGPQPLLGPMMQLKQALSICSPAVSQYAALAAISGPRAPIERARSLGEERRDAVCLALKKASIPHVRPMAGQYVMLDGSATGISGQALVRYVMRHTRVLLSCTATTRSATASWLRLSLTQPSDQLVAAVGRLAPVLTRPGFQGGTHG